MTNLGTQLMYEMCKQRAAFAEKTGSCRGYHGGFGAAAATSLARTLPGRVVRFSWERWRYRLSRSAMRASNETLTRPSPAAIRRASRTAETRTRGLETDSR